MITAEIVNDALNQIGMPIDIVHNEREMILVLNKIMDEWEGL